MKNNLLIALILIISAGCVNSPAEYSIDGVVKVVFNEPFAKLAIETDQGDLYLLEFTNDHVKKCMWNEQGNRVRVFYNKCYYETGYYHLLVTEYTLIMLFDRIDIEAEQ